MYGSEFRTRLLCRINNRGGGGVCVSRGIFGDNCVRIAKERLWSQGEKCVKASELGNLTEIAYRW